MDDDRGSDCPMCAPPPVFHLPPPPCPKYIVGEDTSCPNRLDLQSYSYNFYLALLMAIIAALVLISVIIMVVIYSIHRIRVWRQKKTKHLHMNHDSVAGLDFYSSNKGLMPSLEVPTDITGHKVSVHIDPLYNSMSSASGSDNYTGSTSDGGPHDPKIPFQSHLLPMSPAHTDSEDDSLAPFLRYETDSDQSPSHPRRFYTTLGPRYSTNHYENIPMTNHIRTISSRRPSRPPTLEPIKDPGNGVWKYTRCHITS